MYPKLSLDLPKLRRSNGFPLLGGGGMGGGFNLGGLLGGLGGGGGAVPYEIVMRATGSTLQTSDANVSRVATTANVLTKAFQWKVPAGHSMTFPAGAPFWILLKADGAPGATINGLLQIRVMDPLETKIKQYFSKTTQVFLGNEFDVRQQPTMPISLTAGSEDLVQVWINGDAAHTGSTPGIGTAVESVWFKGLFS
jgi:hypothetical protein